MIYQSCILIIVINVSIINDNDKFLINLLQKRRNFLRLPFIFIRFAFDFTFEYKKKNSWIFSSIYSSRYWLNHSLRLCLMKYYRVLLMLFPICGMKGIPWRVTHERWCHLKNLRNREQVAYKNFLNEVAHRETVRCACDWPIISSQRTKEKREKSNGNGILGDPLLGISGPDAARSGLTMTTPA